MTPHKCQAFYNMQILIEKQREKDLILLNFCFQLRLAKTINYVH